jgi:hypothetical protein
MRNVRRNFEPRFVICAGPCLPADSFIPGARPAQDTRCFPEGNWRTSLISARRFTAESYPMPGILISVEIFILRNHKVGDPLAKQEILGWMTPASVYHNEINFNKDPRKSYS